MDAEQENLVIDVYFSKPILTRGDISTSASRIFRWVDTSRAVVDMLEIWPSTFESQSSGMHSKLLEGAEAFTIVEAMNQIEDIQ